MPNTILTARRPAIFHAKMLLEHHRVDATRAFQASKACETLQLPMALDCSVYSGTDRPTIRDLDASLQADFDKHVAITLAEAREGRREARS